MPATCELCGKHRHVVNKVSHSNIKSKTEQRANLRRVRLLLNGSPRRVRVCSRCLRTTGIVRPSAVKPER
jgi:large subunit ribosomal protein L28